MDREGGRHLVEKHGGEELCERVAVQAVHLHRDQQQELVQFRRFITGKATIALAEPD